MEVTEGLLSDLVIRTRVPYPCFPSADEVAAPHRTHAGIIVTALADAGVRRNSGFACGFPACVAFACLP